MKTYAITFIDNKEYASGQTFQLDRGKSLLNNMLLHNISTHSKCGGKAVCSRCRVKILSDQNYCNKPVKEEKIIFNQVQIEQGWRLACQVYCLRDVSIYLPSKLEIENNS